MSSFSQPFNLTASQVFTPLVTNLSYVSDNGSSLTFGWDAPPGANGATLTYNDFTIYYSVAGAAGLQDTAGFAHVSGTRWQATIPGLTTGLYDVTVSASTVEAGNGSFCPVVLMSVGPPAGVSQVTAGAYPTSKTIAAVWSQPPAVLSFQASIAGTSNGPFTAATMMFDPTQRFNTISGLTAGQMYI